MEYSLSFPRVLNEINYGYIIAIFYLIFGIIIQYRFEEIRNIKYSSIYLLIIVYIIYFGTYALNDARRKTLILTLKLLEANRYISEYHGTIRKLFKFMYGNLWINLFSLIVAGRICYLLYGILDNANLSLFTTL